MTSKRKKSDTPETATEAAGETVAATTVQASVEERLAALEADSLVLLASLQGMEERNAELWKVLGTTSGAINRLERVCFSLVRCMVMHGYTSVPELLAVGDQLAGSENLLEFWEHGVPVAPDAPTDPAEPVSH